MDNFMEDVKVTSDYLRRIFSEGTLNGADGADNELRVFFNLVKCKI
jgi:hypothetical protein